jgi:hypothetical protein
VQRDVWPWCLQPMVAERWHYVAAAAIIAATRPLARRVHPALVREVTSSSASYSRSEGQEEAAMERMCTTVSKLEHQE